MKRISKYLQGVCWGIFLLLCTFLVPLTLFQGQVNASAVMNTYQITHSSADNENIDVAVDSTGTPVAVYDRGGNVYYTKGAGVEELVGAGTNPAISVGPNDIPQVVYATGSAQYYTERNGGTWSTPIQFAAGPVWGNPDIAVDGANHAHIVYAQNVDGDAYGELYYNDNVSGSFNAEYEFADSSYGYGSGGYYFTPGILVDTAGHYYICYIWESWQGNGRDSGGGMGFLTNNGTNCGSDYYGYNSIGFNPKAMTFDASGYIRLSWTCSPQFWTPGQPSGFMYTTIVPSAGSWSATSTGISASNYALSANSTGVGLAYNDGTGNIQFRTDTGSGLGTATLIDSGTETALSLSAHKFIYYIKSDGVHNQVYVQTDTTFPYTLNYTAGSGGTITGDLSQTVASGSDGTLVTAVPNSGYHFVNWSDNGSTTAARTDTNVTANITATASFALNIIVQPSPQSITYGQDAVFNAADVVSYSSVQWQVSTNGGTVWSDVNGANNTTLTLSKPPVSQSGNQYKAIFNLTAGGQETTNSATLTVTPASLTITATGPSKVYGTALSSGTSTTNFNASGMVNGETVTGVTLTPDAAGLAATSAAGASYTITPSLATGTINASNYDISYVLFSGTVSQRAITVTAGASSKGYDGLLTSTGIPTVTAGSLASGDTGTWAETYDNKNVGTTHVMTPSGTVRDGSSVDMTANYNITFTTISSGAITQRAITVTAGVSSKGYDGLLTSTGTPTVTAGSLASGDTGTWAETYDNKNVGTTHVMTPSGTVRDGSSVDMTANYNITFTTISTGTINQASLTVTATGPTKIYGTALSSGTSATNFNASGMVNNETVTGVTLTPDAAGLSSSTAAGSTYTVTPSLATGAGGFLTSNYTITYTSYSGTVAKAALTITVNNQSLIVGDSIPTLTVNYSGFVNGDTSASLTTLPTVVSGTPASSAAGTYTGTLTASGAVSSNYTFTYIAGTLTINAASSSGGGGPSAPVTVVGVTNVTTVVNSNGVFSQGVYAWSDDNKALAYIAAGVNGINSDGTPLTQISMIHIATLPAFQPGAGIIGLAYDFTPAGSTFSPAITIRFAYDPTLIPTGTTVSSLQIAYYDSAQSAWITVPVSSIDTVAHFIYAQISHFTPYAVTYGVKPVTAAPTTTMTTSTTTTPVVTTTPTTTAPSTTTTTTTSTTTAAVTTPSTTQSTTTTIASKTSNTMAMIIIIIVAVVVVVGLGIWLFMTRRKK